MEILLSINEFSHKKFFKLSHPLQLIQWLEKNTRIQHSETENIIKSLEILKQNFHKIFEIKHMQIRFKQQNLFEIIDTTQAFQVSSSEVERHFFHLTRVL